MNRIGRILFPWAATNRVFEILINRSFLFVFLSTSASILMLLKFSFFYSKFFYLFNRLFCTNTDFRMSDTTHIVDRRIYILRARIIELCNIRFHTATWFIDPTSALVSFITCHVCARLFLNEVIKVEKKVAISEAKFAIMARCNKKWSENYLSINNKRGS